MPRLDSTDGSSGLIFERVAVVAPRILVPAEPVERSALHREDVPVRIIRRVCAAERVEALLVLAVVDQRAAIGCDQRAVVRIDDGRLFQHGSRLRALAGGAQRLAVAKRSFRILRVGAIALAIDLDGLAPVGIGLRRRACGDRAGHLVLDEARAAAGARGRDRQDARRENESDRGSRTHADIHSFCPREQGRRTDQQ